MDLELRTPREWEEIMADGRRVIDPDGWRGTRLPAKDFDEPITLIEYEERAVSSTCRYAKNS